MMRLEKSEDLAISGISFMGFSRLPENVQTKALKARHSIAQGETLGLDGEEITSAESASYRQEVMARFQR